MINELLRHDRAIGDAAAQYRHSTVMKIVGPASDVGDQWQLFSLCVSVAVYGLARKNYKLLATGAEMTAAMLTATALKNVIKGQIDRTRPFVPADGGTYVFERGKHDVPELDSFPSGHTAGAVAVAQTVARQYPQVALPAIATAAAVALVQMPRGKHYPTDLFVGMIAGLASNFVVSKCWRLLRKLNPYS